MEFTYGKGYASRLLTWLIYLISMQNRYAPFGFFTITTGEDQAERDGSMTPNANIFSTSSSINFCTYGETGIIPLFDGFTVADVNYMLYSRCTT
jgi:hypothetical protein